jgi:hypothetical protein
MFCEVGVVDVLWVWVVFICGLNVFFGGVRRLSVMCQEGLCSGEQDYGFGVEGCGCSAYCLWRC